DGLGFGDSWSSGGSGDSCSGELVGSGPSVGGAGGRCAGSVVGAAGDSDSAGSDWEDGVGDGGLITVSTRFVQTAGFGLPVAAKPVSARMPVSAMARATGANRHARTGAAAVV